MKIVTGEELAGKTFEVLEDGSLREVGNRKYIPECGDEYWYLTVTGNNVSRTNEGTDGDKWLIKHNHVFMTKKECKRYLKFIRLLDAYTFEPDWKDEDESRYCPAYDFESNTVWLERADTQKIGMYYFKSSLKFNEFVEKAGTSNIKHFLFDIWD